MSLDLLRQILVEIDDASTSKRAVNAECVLDRALFNSYVSRLNDEGCVKATVQPDMRTGGIHAVVARGLTPIRQDLLTAMRDEELFNKAKEAGQDSRKLAALAVFLKMHSKKA